MFVHTGENLPKDPEYPLDSEKLGYKVNKDRQIVSIEHGHHFLFFHTNNDRANDKRKEAMHESIRRLVADELKGLGVDEVCLGGDGGKEVLGLHREAKPYVQHITILASALPELKYKRDVIVVIGEPSEDAGIWAWRHLLGHGGIDGGSAVGLVKKLAELGMDSMEIKPEGIVAATAEATKGPKPGPTTEKTQTPGLIILNPGALYWSNIEHKTMTWPTWRSRPRLHALGENYVIGENHNYVQGHSDPVEHIETCLDFILPQLIAEDAQLYIVGISNSAEYFINWFQTRQCTNGTSHSGHADVPGIHRLISAMAFMEPTHDATKIKCQTAEMMLNNYGRQWIKSSQPLGTFLNHPKGPKTPDLPSLPTATKGSYIRLPDYAAANPAAQSVNTVLDNPIIGEEPAEISTLDTSKPTPATNGQDELVEVSQTEVQAEPDNVDDVMAGSYDHTKEVVSCPTYSRETDIDEMIWPNVMDKVLDFFKFEAEKTARRGFPAQ